MERKLNIIFVEKDRLFLSDGTNILQCVYPEKSVENLEIMQPEAVKSAISKFVFDNKIVVGNLVIVFSETVCFREDAELLKDADLEKRMADFRQLVPFDNVVSRSYVFQNGVRFVGMNKDLFDLVSEQFSSLGFEILAAVPANYLPGMANKITLDEELIKFVQGSMATIKDGNILSQSKLTQVQTEMSATKPKSMLPYLLIVFLVLLAILVIYLLTSF